jgi:hypothetical protein
MFDILTVAGKGLFTIRRRGGKAREINKIPPALGAQAVCGVATGIGKRP